jgi:formaldehyde-activating enzyme involved in methanogenesis
MTLLKEEQTQVIIILNIFFNIQAQNKSKNQYSIFQQLMKVLVKLIEDKINTKPPSLISLKIT